MSDKEIFKMHADVCKALGNPIRIEVIDLIQEDELSFSEILEKTGTQKSNLSQHLSTMAKKGILNVRREGQHSYYSLASKKVATACRLMREVLIEKLEKQQSLLKQIS